MLSRLGLLVYSCRLIGSNTSTCNVQSREWQDDKFQAAGSFEIGKCMDIGQAHLAAHHHDESHSI